MKGLEVISLHGTKKCSLHTTALHDGAQLATFFLPVHTKHTLIRSWVNLSIAGKRVPRMRTKLNIFRKVCVRSAAGRDQFLGRHTLWTAPKQNFEMPLSLSG